MRSRPVAVWSCRGCGARYRLPPEGVGHQGGARVRCPHCSRVSALDDVPPDRGRPGGDPPSGDPAAPVNRGVAGRVALVPTVLFIAGVALGGGGVAAWALADRPQGPGTVVGGVGGGSKVPPMKAEPRRPVSVRDVMGPPAEVTLPAGVALDAPGGVAEAHKILARTLRREGKFAAAAQAADHYRAVRLRVSP